MLKTWIIYSPKNSLYCFCCQLFAQGSKSSFAYYNGWNSYWRLNPKVKEHESSQAHCMVFTQWKELEVRIHPSETIDKKEQTIVKENIRKCRDVLTRLVDIIRFLIKQNLALRGHRERMEDKDDTGRNDSKNRGLLFGVSGISFKI